MSALPKTQDPSPAILTRLNSDHQHLASVLEVFEHQYRAFETEEGPDYDLLRDILDYVQSFPDSIHHPTENLLFNYLLRYARLSQGEQAAIADNRDQHEKLVEATQTLLRMIDHVFDNGIVDGAALKLTMSRYLSEQLRHMEFESRYLFPLAEARLSERDWAALENQLTRVENPLFNAYDEQYELLRQQIETRQKDAA